MPAISDQEHYMHAHNFKAARRLLTALALWLATGTAMAAPQYHVDLDTHGLSGTGWLDLQFNPGLDGAPATATLSGFSGLLAAGLAPEVQGAVGGSLPGALAFSSSTAFNALFQPIQLGGVIGFNLEFSGASSVFSVGLYGGDKLTALGDGDPFTNSLATFELGGPRTVYDAARVTLSAAPAVPEPPAGAMLLAALAVAAVMRRRA
jgi:hypothetical protein